MTLCWAPPWIRRDTQEPSTLQTRLFGESRVGSTKEDCLLNSSIESYFVTCLNFWLLLMDALKHWKSIGELLSNFPSLEIRNSEFQSRNPWYQLEKSIFHRFFSFHFTLYVLDIAVRMRKRQQWTRKKLYLFEICQTLRWRNIISCHTEWTRGKSEKSSGFRLLLVVCEMSEAENKLKTWNWREQIIK